MIHDIEGGAKHLDVARIAAPSSWDAYLAEARELATENHSFKSYVVDTLDALEALATAAVCEKNHKQTLADFSWGGGTRCSFRVAHLPQGHGADPRQGVNIILIAHEHRKSFSDPELGSFEMYRPKLQEKAWALTNEWCDAVLFAQFDQALLEKDGQRARAIVSGRRVLRTQRGTGYVAKNRYGLPETIDLDWKTLKTAAQPADARSSARSSTRCSANSTEPTKLAVTKWLTERGESPEVLRAATERVQKRLAEKQPEGEKEHDQQNRIVQGPGLQKMLRMSKKKGTPFVGVKFRVIDGEFSGDTLKWEGTSRTRQEPRQDRRRAHHRIVAVLRLAWR